MNAPAYTFRPLSHADEALLRIWLALPHVAEWNEDPGQELVDMLDHIGSVSVSAYIVEWDGRPLGYIQSYAPHLEDDHPYRDQPPGTMGIDQFIGPAELLNQGHGSRFVAAFVERLFAAGVPRVIIDPDPNNARAIRAYEKAGFVAFDTRSSIYGDALMMARNAPNATGNE